MILGLGLLAAGPTVLAENTTVHEPRAIVINVTEQDLNRVLRDSFHAGGGPSFEGQSARPSRGVSGLHYRASLSEPTLELARDGQARVSLDILDADLEIDRFERRIAGRLAFCEGAGMSLHAADPVDVDLAMQLVIDGGDLRILPQSVALSESSGEFQLVKPTRCGNTFVPRWLLWQLGKSKLRRKIDKLDDVLLARARKMAEQLNAGGLLKHDVKVRSRRDGGNNETFRFYPELLDTSQGSLYVSLAFSNAALAEAAAGQDAPTIAASGSSSFVAISAPFLNSVLKFAFADAPETRRHKPSGHFAKMFKSSSIYALIPGLREVESRDDLRVSFRLHAPPEIAFAEGERGALIRVVFSGIEMDLWSIADGREALLGTVAIDSGRLVVLPFVNVLGGLSFEMLENEWSVSSSGIEFNDEALAATLQEMIFGEAFETTYEPIARGAFALGKTDFAPQNLRLAGDYLVIELAGPRESVPAGLVTRLPAPPTLPPAAR